MREGRRGGGKGGETSSAYYAATASPTLSLPLVPFLPIRGNTPIDKYREASLSNQKSDYTIIDAPNVSGSMAMYPHVSHTYPFSLLLLDFKHSLPIPRLLLQR